MHVRRAMIHWFEKEVLKYVIHTSRIICKHNLRISTSSAISILNKNIQILPPKFSTQIFYRKAMKYLAITYNSKVQFPVQKPNRSVLLWLVRKKSRDIIYFNHNKSGSVGIKQIVLLVIKVHILYVHTYICMLLPVTVCRNFMTGSCVKTEQILWARQAARRCTQMIRLTETHDIQLYRTLYVFGIDRILLAIRFIRYIMECYIQS